MNGAVVGQLVSFGWVGLVGAAIIFGSIKFGDIDDSGATAILKVVGISLIAHALFGAAILIT